MTTAAHSLHRLYAELVRAVESGPTAATVTAIGDAQPLLAALRAADVVEPWRGRGEAPPVEILDRLGSALASAPPALGEPTESASAARWILGAERAATPDLVDHGWSALLSWTELAAWAARSWGLATLPLTDPARDQLGARSLDLVRGLVSRLLAARVRLAELVPAARLVRWLAVLPPVPPSLARTVDAAIVFIGERAVLLPEARFHLAVARRDRRTDG